MCVGGKIILIRLEFYWLSWRWWNCVGGGGGGGGKKKWEKGGCDAICRRWETNVLGNQKWPGRCRVQRLTSIVSCRLIKEISGHLLTYYPHLRYLKGLQKHDRSIVFPWLTVLKAKKKWGGGIKLKEGYWRLRRRQWLSNSLRSPPQVTVQLFHFRVLRVDDR